MRAVVVEAFGDASASKLVCLPGPVPKLNGVSFGSVRKIAARGSEWFARRLAVRIGGEFALNDVAEAHRLLKSRESRGKLLLKSGRRRQLD